MCTLTTIGLDLAKLVFSICEQDAGGRILRRKDLRRAALAPWLAQLPAGTVVAMEACSGAHHWARCCHSYGLQPKLMAAQFEQYNATAWLKHPMSQRPRSKRAHRLLEPPRIARQSDDVGNRSDRPEESLANKMAPSTCHG